MKFFKLLLLAALSAIILTGCERQFVSPIDPTDPSQTTAQLAQKALSDLADTAAERGFVDLANAANEVVEVLAIETGTTTETAFWKLFQQAIVLEQGFASANCEIKLGGFTMALERAANVYATEGEPRDKEQVLENLAQETLNAGTILRQFPVENAFIPFAFGAPPYSYLPPDSSNTRYGCDNHMIIFYDETIRSMIITRAAVVEFLTLKGYAMVQIKSPSINFEFIFLNAPFNSNIMEEELTAIPGVAKIGICGVDYNRPYDPKLQYIELEPVFNLQSLFNIVDRVRARYNEAWCQGNFDVIDSILIEESRLDFFDYAFVRNLADIYAEEIPEAAERIQTNSFSLHMIAIRFLFIYHALYSEGSDEELIELFRQSIRDGYVTIEHLNGSGLTHSLPSPAGG